MQFAFLTFFLGLVSGSETVAFAAGPEVAAIEVRLDGAAAARLAAAPWEAKVDFGTALLPHHLEARALDGRGGEMARVEQWINVPRRAAEAEIVVERAPAGQPRTVRLAWQSVTSEVPRKAELTFDGAPLKLDREYRAALPPMRGTATHVLSADLQFADGVTARHDLALGGEYDDAVATELTAVPVWLPPHVEVPPVAQLQSWFAEAGQPLQVHAVDASAPRLIAVRDPAATRSLLAIGWIGKHENNFLLSHGTRMRFIWPQAKPFAASGLPGELFGGGSSLDVAQHGIPWLLANVVHPGSDRPRLADAAAVSALDLSASAGPRAVLVVGRPALRARRSPLAGRGDRPARNRRTVGQVVGYRFPPAGRRRYSRRDGAGMGRGRLSSKTPLPAASSELDRSSGESARPMANAPQAEAAHGLGARRPALG
jgi:hypothetical protein